MYAKETSVSVERSRAEIEKLVGKYGATRFASLLEDGYAAILFEAQHRRVQFELPLPSRKDFGKAQVRGHWRARTPEQQAQAWEQACRQRWRALALVIKAKLEAVESGITTFEDEFLAHIILPGQGGTVGKWFKTQLENTYKTGKLPPMLGAGRPEDA